jgi:hypothetical protein
MIYEDCDVVNNEKKKQELWWLKKFLKLLNGSMQIEKIQCGESPDFILSFKQKKIGLESINHHSDENEPHGSEEMRYYGDFKKLKKIIEEKGDKYPELRGITVYFSSFKESRLPPKKRNKEFAEEFIKILIEESNNMESNDIDIRPTNNYPVLKKYLTEFSLMKTDNHYFTFDAANYATGFSFTEKKLIHTIKKKEPKVDIYRKKQIHEVWLLVVCGQGTIPNDTSYHLKNRLNNWGDLTKLLINSKFNRVYLFDVERHSIYEWPQSQWIKIM